MYDFTLCTGLAFLYNTSGSSAQLANMAGANSGGHYSRIILEKPKNGIASGIKTQ